MSGSKLENHSNLGFDPGGSIKSGVGINLTQLYPLRFSAQGLEDVEVELRWSFSPISAIFSSFLGLNVHVKN